MPDDSRATPRLLKQINACLIDPALLTAALEQNSEWRAAGSNPDDLESGMAAVVLSHGLQGEQAALTQMALHVRLSALWRLVSAGAIRGFQDASTENGAPRHFVDDVVLRCAASEPLNLCDGPVSFDEDSFNRRLLKEVSVAGSA